MDFFGSRPGRWLRRYLNSHPRAEQYADLAVRPLETALKKSVWGCQMCGQCILHSNGMTCPMRCPKQLRNGPCGGVRKNGHCEVYPERMCVWYLAFYRSQKIPIYRDHIFHRNSPVDWRLRNTSSWINWLTGRDAGIPREPPAPQPARGDKRRAR